MTKFGNVVIIFFLIINISILFIKSRVKKKTIKEKILKFINIIDDGQYSRTLIELRGNGFFPKKKSFKLTKKIIVQITFQERKYNIVTYILFPFSFPQVAPMIKLKNIDRLTYLNIF